MTQRLLAYFLYFIMLPLYLIVNEHVHVHISTKVTQLKDKGAPCSYKTNAYIMDTRSSKLAYLIQYSKTPL